MKCQALNFVITHDSVSNGYQLSKSFINGIYCTALRMSNLAQFCKYLRCLLIWKSHIMLVIQCVGFTRLDAYSYSPQLKVLVSEFQLEWKAHLIKTVRACASFEVLTAVKWRIPSPEGSNEGILIILKSQVDKKKGANLPLRQKKNTFLRNVANISS